MRLLFTICIAFVLVMGMAPKTSVMALPLLDPNGLLLPDGDTVHGLVEIRGIAQHPTFRKWQIDLQLYGDPVQTTFVAVGETEQHEPGRLMTLDSTRYPDGKHTLRLRVVHSNLNYDEYFTPIAIDNSGAATASDSALEAATETDAPAAPLVADAPLGLNVPDGERRIEVDISDQTLTAWQGDAIVLRTVVSTGRADYPTVTGSWPIRSKLTSTRMIGPGYDTPDVPWTMYYYRGYAVHGAYWHNNFGTPVSHGCVNMRPSEAKLLFNWASEGTTVTVHE